MGRLKREEGSSTIAKRPRQDVLLAAHIEAVREEERAAIARDLHDELGSLLVRLRMELALLVAQLPAQPPQLRERSLSIERLLEQALGTVQRVVGQLRPGILKEFGLAEALRCQIEEFASSTGLHGQARCEEAGNPADEETGLALFRIAQEALTNILKHAQAQRVSLDLSRREGRVCMEVTDDGCGIAPEDLQKTRSFGLRGIRERVLRMHGTFDIGALSQGGTRLRVCVPAQGRQEVAPSQERQPDLFATLW